jgi:Tol biopolymer transport system component
MKYRKTFSIGIAVFAAFILGCASDDNPVNLSQPIQPLEGQLIFTSQIGVFSIFIINHDGTGLKKLTDGFEPEVSPDGKNVLFTAQDSSGVDLYVMSIDGSSKRNLTRTRVSDSEGDWSADGSMIVYQSGPNGSADHIWVMNADGSGQRQVTANTAAFNHSPCWSPDGKRIAFEWSRKNAEGNYSGYDEIHLINVDGSGEINLASDAMDPEWCPDGSMLAFQQKGVGMYVINANGSGLRTILPSAPYYGGSIQWSPDGKRIAFAQYIAPGANVFVVNQDGTGKTQLTNFPDEGLETIVWSFDGNGIGFVRNGDLYVMKADGSDLKRITDDMKISAICWIAN